MIKMIKMIMTMIPIRVALPPNPGDGAAPVRNSRQHLRSHLLCTLTLISTHIFTHTLLIYTKILLNIFTHTLLSFTKELLTFLPTPC